MAESSYDEGINYDEFTLAQVEKIQKEIAETSEFISQKEDINSLEKEYSHEDIIYQTKIKDLNKSYSHLRRTRGDGNCFYRAFSFAYMEQMLQDHSDIPRVKEKMVGLKEKIATMYPGYDFDEFQDVVLDLLDSTTKPDASIEQLRKSFSDSSTSNYIVCYLRILTSGYLQLNADFFQAFIDGGLSVKEYCNKEVDPMYRESDHVHISALTSALEVSVRVIYMDRGEGGEVNHHDFPEGSPPFIHLLYRPGHYDILYPISNNR